MQEARIARLTERQKEVLRLYQQRLDRKQIARELDLSPETVKQHLEAARLVLGVSRSADAARILAESEGQMAPPRRGMPSQVISAPPEVVLLSDGPTEGLAEVQRARVEEATTIYSPPSLPLAERIEWPFPNQRKPTNDLALLSIMVWVLLGAIALGAGAVLLIAVGGALYDEVSGMHRLLLRLI